MERLQLVLTLPALFPATLPAFEIAQGHEAVVGVEAGYLYSTVMGPFLGEWHPVDVEYSAECLMLTRKFEKRSAALRYDYFIVTQSDRLPEDNNPENSHAWTLNCQYAFSDKLTLAADWLSIKTHHCGWICYGLEHTATERQTRLSLRLRFWSHIYRGGLPAFPS